MDKNSGRSEREGKAGDTKMQWVQNKHILYYFCCIFALHSCFDAMWNTALFPYCEPGLSVPLSRYDVDRSGFIDLMELKLMMEKLGEPQTHLGLKAMIKEVDEDNDGEISFREVCLSCVYVKLSWWMYCKGRWNGPIVIAAHIYNAHGSTAHLARTTVPD